MSECAEDFASRPDFAPSPNCTWLQDDDTDSNLWETDCGESFSLEEGGPVANNMRFCCYCGKQLVEAFYEPADDEEGDG